MKYVCNILKSVTHYNGTNSSASLQQLSYLFIIEYCLLFTLCFLYLISFISPPALDPVAVVRARKRKLLPAILACRPCITDTSSQPDSLVSMLTPFSPFASMLLKEIYEVESRARLTPGGQAISSGNPLITFGLGLGSHSELHTNATQDPAIWQ